MELEGDTASSVTEAIAVLAVAGEEKEADVYTSSDSDSSEGSA